MGDSGQDLETAVGVSDAGLASHLDSISLEQALVDFEIANARVMDLTQRMLDLQGLLNESRAQRERDRAEHSVRLQTQEVGFAADRTELEALRAITRSRSYLLVRAIRGARRIVKG